MVHLKTSENKSVVLLDTEQSKLEMAVLLCHYDFL